MRGRCCLWRRCETGRRRWRSDGVVVVRGVHRSLVAWRGSLRRRRLWRMEGNLILEGLVVVVVETDFVSRSRVPWPRRLPLWLWSWLKRTRLLVHLTGEDRLEKDDESLTMISYSLCRTVQLLEKRRGNRTKKLSGCWGGREAGKCLDKKNKTIQR